MRQNLFELAARSARYGDENDFDRRMEFVVCEGGEARHVGHPAGVVGNVAQLDAFEIEFDHLEFAAGNERPNAARVPAARHMRVPALNTKRVSGAASLK